jgi:hypothetical protein
MMDRLVGAIPNLPAAGVVVPSLRVALPVASGLYPAAVGAGPAVAVPIQRAAAVPSPED